ncbi:hypothetical protein Taro_056312 [Colocasia esculenta]|uniref:Pectinesterase n=1 Tax=Colocasia esculenta TaxID=4460 RepID=A0A843XW90_COLES|nr:hypothetical protein [Colocasia esculenta]
MGAGSKVVALAVSMVLLVAIVIGVAVAVGKSNHNVGKSFNIPGGGGAGDGVATTSKSVSAMCAVTDYKETCVKSLGSVLGNNGSVSVQDIVKVAMEVTLNASIAAFEKVNVSFDKAALPNATADDRRNEGAISDCQELMRLSAFQLEKIISSVNATDMKSLQERSNDVNVWLSAAISYHWTCLDAVEHPELKAQMEKIIVESSQLADNALAIVTEVVSMLKTMQGLQIPLQTPTENRRRLLQDNGLDEEGYPTWLLQNDRRLLAGRVSVSRPRPNVVVAKDGSGNFNTISAAINAMPKNYGGRYVIYVKAGVYNENVLIDEKRTNVFMYGDGPRKTIVTGHKNYVDAVPTFATATFAVIGDGFICRAMGFQNTAGAVKQQAVALRVQSDRAVFYNCRVDAYQDTLYVQSGRQFFRNCVISGTVDFIFGASAAVIQNSLIVVRRPMDNQRNMVTAHGRTKPDQNTAIVIHNCRIVPEQKLFPDRFKIPSYLGRPWKQYSRTVVMETTIGDLIQPEGWFPWKGDFALNTLYYAEHANRGPGANTARRVRWPGYKGAISRAEASKFTAGSILGARTWMPTTGVPYLLWFKY